MSLRNKTFFISGGSRGIGLAIALRAARDGVNIAIVTNSLWPRTSIATAAIDLIGGVDLPRVA